MKWQPVMIITEVRIECECGNLAIFITLEGKEDDRDYCGWCQDCFDKAQREEEE